MRPMVLFLSTLLCSTILAGPVMADIVTETQNGMVVKHNDGTGQNVSNNVLEGDATIDALQGGGIYFNPSTDTALSTLNKTVENNVLKGGTDGTFQGYAMGAGGYFRNMSISELSGSFNNNVIKNVDSGVGGGVGVYADANVGSKINLISADFSNNEVWANHTAFGGGLFVRDISVDEITGTYSNNRVRSNSAAANSLAQGGGIYVWETSTVGKINGVFIDNKAEDSSQDANAYESAVGGAIGNNGVINSVEGKFINNHAYNDRKGTVGGGAIGNNGGGKIGSIDGYFNLNHARSGERAAKGGAILNYDGTIEAITGAFVGNFAQSDATASSADGYADGGAILNQEGQIGFIEADFEGNYAVSTNARASGGAINNNTRGAILEGLIGDFKGNYVKTTGKGTLARGGAIHNVGQIGYIIGDFDGNHADSETGQAIGGAIVSVASSKAETFIGHILNSSFTNNYVTGDETSTGGAIYAERDTSIVADGGTSLFRGNYVLANGQKINNAIYMKHANLVDLRFSAANEGEVIVDDEIDGVHYDVTIDGDTTGLVRFNNHVKNINNFIFTPTSVFNLGLNAKVATTNMYVNDNTGVSPIDLDDDIDGGMGIVATDSTFRPQIKVDVNVDAGRNTVTAGSITASGDIIGNYGVIVNALTPDVLPNIEDAVVPFVFAPNDIIESPSDFTVDRVIGSPYLWETALNVKGEETGSTWYLNLMEEENPDYVPSSQPVLAPEVKAAASLPLISIEQTRSVVRRVGDAVEASRKDYGRCKTEKWDSNNLYNVWGVAQGETANLTGNFSDIDAKIWGVETGFDFQKDPCSTLGTFVSFRKGQYDVTSGIDTEFHTDSYLGGLYYRFTRNHNRVFATVYGGAQHANAKTDDGIATFKANAVQLGASIEAGHTFTLSDTLTVEPTVGVRYTWINYDDADDNVGKEYKWDDVHHIELELGASVAKQFKKANVYVKPSVLQTISSGGDVVVGGLMLTDTLDNQTLGRIEAGLHYDFNDALSSYGWTNYTGGKDYNAIAVGLGLSYAF